MTFSSNSVISNRLSATSASFSANNTSLNYSTKNYLYASSPALIFNTIIDSSFYINSQGVVAAANQYNELKQFINSNNSTLPSLTNSYFSDLNYIIVNNGSSDWILTLPLGPNSSTTSSWVSGMILVIKKTGSGTLTIQTQADVLSQKTRGINVLTNKSLIMSNNTAQSLKLLYISGFDSQGNADNKVEIWHVIQDKQLNPTNSNGSILFAGSTSTYLTVANDADFRFETGDFTIEWWQYETDSNGFPRIFSMGTYPSASIGVSIEGGIFYLWIGGAANSFGTLTNYKNVFNHFAIVRSGTTIKVFRNGTQLGSNLTSSYNFNDTTNDLRIGNESVLSTGSAFGGNIKGFHWVKGTALYSSNFTPNYNSITPHANSKLLLNVANSAGLVTDSSGLNKTVTNTGCTFSSITHPFY